MTVPWSVAQFSLQFHAKRNCVRRDLTCFKCVSKKAATARHDRSHACLAAAIDEIIYKAILRAGLIDTSIRRDMTSFILLTNRRSSANAAGVSHRVAFISSPSVFSCALLSPFLERDLACLA